MGYDVMVTTIIKFIVVMIRFFVAMKRCFVVMNDVVREVNYNVEEQVDTERGHYHFPENNRDER